MIEEEQRVYLGVDIGGSHVSVGLVSDQGELIYNEEHPIVDATQMAATNLVELIVTMIHQVMGGSSSNVSDSVRSTTISTGIISRLWKVSGLASSFESLGKRKRICGIGVGCPGQSKDGILVAASNFPLLKNAPLVDMLHGYNFLADTPQYTTP